MLRRSWANMAVVIAVVMAVALGVALVAIANTGSWRPPALASSSRVPLAEGPARFVDAWSYFDANAANASQGDLDVARRSLNAQFLTLCDDTFCNGDEANVTPLAFDCSVEAESGQIGACVWVFAGSYTMVDAETGKLQVKPRINSCDLGFKGHFRDLTAFLHAAAQAGASGGEGLRGIIVPGRGQSLLDILRGCL